MNFSLPLAGRQAGDMAQRALELGALVEGPVQRPWNVRDVVVRKPDGYLVVFTEPIDITAAF